METPLLTPTPAPPARATPAIAAGAGAVGHDRRLRAVLGALQDGLVVVDGDGTVVEVNERFCELVGVGRDCLLGSAPPYPFWAEEALRENRAALAVALGVRSGAFEVLLRRDDGTRFLARVEVSPLLDEDGTPEPGFLCTVRDLTREAAERERLREAHAVARLATWEWNPRHGRVSWVGYIGPRPEKEAGEMPLEELLRRIPEPHGSAVRDGLWGLAAGRSPLALQFPVDNADGKRVWRELRGRSVDLGGGAVVVRGTSQDITALWQAREEVDAARVFWQVTLESLPAHVAVLDGNATIIAVNRAWSEFAARHGGLTAGVGSNYLAACDAAGPDDRVAVEVASGLRAILAGEREELVMEYACPTPDEQLWFALHAAPFRGPGSRRLVVQHQDVTARRRADERLRLRAEMLDAVDASVVATEMDFVITHWNRGAERLFGWTADEAIGRCFVDLVMGDAADPAQAASFEANLQQHGRWEGEVDLRGRDGRTLRVHATSALLRTDEGRPSGIVSVAVDLSERVETERRLRTAEDFLRTVTNSMAEGLFTLDGHGRLTFINDAAERMLGWRTGEIEGKPMHDLVHYRHADGSPHRPEECPIEQARARGDAVRVEDDVFLRRDGTCLPVAYASTPFTTGDGANGWVVVFTDTTERKAHAERMRRQIESLSWHGRLRHALAHDQFVLAAQPIIDLATGDTVQHELLLRLREHDGTIVPPGQFLPAAEESGLIRDIDRWVVRQAATLAARGHAVEFNVSGSSLGETEFHVLTERAIEESGADPSLMVIELTETALLRNEVSAKAFIERISALGCRFALDDFGTGYAGFTHLKRLPVNFLKIDKEFVRELPRDDGNRHVVQAVVNLARGFGQQTVAEGVESHHTLALLREIGVDFAQGYVIGRPRPIDRAFPLRPA